MRGNDKVISRLNILLSNYHTAYYQNTTHCAVCTKRGSVNLANLFSKFSEEYTNAIFIIISRILFLEGSQQLQSSVFEEVELSTDVVNTLPISKGSNVKLIGVLAESLDIAQKVGDYGSRKLFENLIVDEERRLGLVESKMYKSMEKVNYDD